MPLGVFYIKQNIHYISRHYIDFLSYIGFETKTMENPYWSTIWGFVSTFMYSKYTSDKKQHFPLTVHLPVTVHITPSNLLTADTDDSTTLLLSGMPVNPGGGLLTTGPRPGGGGGGGSVLGVLFNGNALLKPTRHKEALMSRAAKN